MCSIRFLFSGSRYAKRLPIGLPDVIKNIPRKRVIDFYETWYRPELMTLIMVGDFDPTTMTKKITEKLSKLDSIIGATSGTTAKPKARPEYTVPLKSAKRALVFTDPELEFVVVNFGSLTRKKNVVTENDFKQNVIHNIAENIFNERLAERVQEEGTPLLDTGVGISGILKQTVLASVAFVPKSDLFNESFMTVLDETEKIVRFGVSASEVERQKADMLSSAKTAWQNKDKTENGALIGRLESDVLDETPFFSIDTYYTTLQKALELITAADVNEAVKKYFAGRGTLLIVTAPESANLPPKKEIVKLWKTYKAQNLHANEENTLDERALFPPDVLARWKQHAQSEQSTQSAQSPQSTQSERALQVTQTQSMNAPDPTIIELTLANKSRVVVTQTDFKEGEFLFNAVSRGGLSLVEDENFPSASVAFDWVESSGLNGFNNAELAKKLAGKTLSLQLSASDSAITFSGGGNTDDIETLFQLVALYFTNPDFTQAAWERIKSGIELDIANQKNDPRSVFVKAVQKAIYGDSVRYGGYTDRFLRMIDLAQCEKIFKSYFSDASNWTFIFTGSVTKERITELSQIYFAQLDSAAEGASGTEPKSRVQAFPAGIVPVNVAQGIEDKSQVLIIFGGENEIVESSVTTEAELVRALADLIEMRLREQMREKIGATYGVGVTLSQANYPSRRFIAQIYFSCESANAEKLADMVIAEIERITQSAPPTIEEIGKLKESFLRRYETALKTNEFWAATLVRNRMRKDDSAAIAQKDEVIAALTVPVIQKLLVRYFNTKNYIRGILMPKEK